MMTNKPTCKYNESRDRIQVFWEDSHSVSSRVGDVTIHRGECGQVTGCTIHGVRRLGEQKRRGTSSSNASDNADRICGEINDLLDPELAMKEKGRDASEAMDGTMRELGDAIEAWQI